MFKDGHEIGIRSVNLEELMGGCVEHVLRDRRKKM